MLLLMLLLVLMLVLMLLMQIMMLLAAVGKCSISASNASAKMGPSLMQGPRN